RTSCRRLAVASALHSGVLGRRCQAASSREGPVAAEDGEGKGGRDGGGAGAAGNGPGCPSSRSQCSTVTALATPALRFTLALVGESGREDGGPFLRRHLGGPEFSLGQV